ncbi:hypothetical protein [Brasilonema sp. UFV-L1]|nr:hypothetical protein [Brasilonema sp. UFV-L1]
MGESWQKTAYQATSRAVDTVTTTLEQAKASSKQYNIDSGSNSYFFCG